MAQKINTGSINVKSKYQIEYEAKVRRQMYMSDEEKIKDNAKENSDLLSFSNFRDSFNFSDNLDEHINKSIRGYDLLTDDIVNLSTHFVVDDSNVYDLGCSNGTTINRIRENNIKSRNVYYYGIDFNPSFDSGQNYINMFFKREDIRCWKNIGVDNQYRTNSSFILSMFTMQFIEEDEKLKLLDEIFNKSLRVGGALILCEKIVTPDKKFQNMMDFMYKKYMSQFFYEDDILKKEKELRHLAKLQTEEDIINNLKKIGFRNIEIFWKNLNFIGLVGIK